MDFSKLSMGAKLALIGGAVLVINLFLDWYSIDFGIGSVGANAFDAGFFAWFGSVAAIAGAVILLLKAFGQSQVNAGQFKTEQLALLLGAGGFVLIVLQYLTEGDAREFASLGMWRRLGDVVPSENRTEGPSTGAPQSRLAEVGPTAIGSPRSRRTCRSQRAVGHQPWPRLGLI